MQGRKPFAGNGISRPVSPPAHEKTPRSRHFATVGLKWREPDSNRRPRGYEPRELPGCSIPRCFLMSMPSLDVRSYLTTACYCQGIPAEECRHKPNHLVELLIVLWCIIIHRIRDFRVSFLSSHGVSCVPGFFCWIVEGHPSAAGSMNPLDFCLKARGERAV